MRSIHDPQAVAQTACRMVADHLQVERAYWTEIDWQTREYVISVSFQRPGVSPVSGRFGFDAWEPFTTYLLQDRPVVVDDTHADPRLTDLIREGYAHLQVGADIAIPVTVGGQLRSLLAVNQRAPRRWTDDEATLLRGIAVRCWAEVERARAEKALRDSEEKFRTLFETIDEGYCLLELVLDASGRVVDWIYLEVNASFVRQAGDAGRAVVGKRGSEWLPNFDRQWLDMLTGVYQTGEPLRTEIHAEDLDRWVSAHYSRVGGAGSPFIATVFDDISDHKRAELALREREERQAFLLRFSDALRAEPDADAVAYRAIRMLGDEMALDRCYITFYRPEDDAADFPYQVGNDSVPPLPPRVRLSDFPEAYAQVLEKTFVIEDDFERRGLTPEERANSKVLGMRAMIASTVRKGERNPICSMAAVSSRPRRWTPGEIALVEETAERTWAAMERALAESALRASEAKYRALYADLAPSAAVDRPTHGDAGAP